MQHPSTTIWLRVLALCVCLGFAGANRTALQAQECPTFSLKDASACPKHEMRAVWLATLNGMDWPRTQATSAEGIRRQQEELCRQLDELKRTGINTVILQTRLRDDAIYPSRLQPWAGCLTGTPGKDPGYDPLAFAIEACHRRGMEVHAWVVAIPLGNDQQVKKAGRRSTTRLHPELCVHYQRAWYLNPGHPGTKDFLASIVEEIVRRYDVDGINLDYIRYPDRPQRFPDSRTYRKYGKGRSLSEWRRNNITAIVEHLYHTVKSIKPWVKVGSSPLGKYADVSRYSARGWNAYHAVFQEAQLWMSRGIHDVLFPMLYFRGNNYYPFALDWQENCHGRTIVPGLGIYFLDPKEGDWNLKEVMQQIHFTRAAHIPGQAYFRTRFLLDNTQGLLDAVRTQVYTHPALVPPMTWMDSIPPTAPASLEVLPQADSVVVRWKAVADASPAANMPLPPMRYNLYACTGKRVDTEQAAHLKAIYLTDTCYVLPKAEAETLHFAVTAVDAYGNESEACRMEPAGHTPGHTPRHVELPPDDAAVQLIVTDLYDRIVWQEAYPRRLSIERFAHGFYKIKVIKKDGQVQTLQYFTR